MRYFEEKKKAIMGEIDYGLPKNYRPVEYLEAGSQKQWFDTGIKGSYNLRVEGEWWVDVSTIENEYVIFFQGENAIIRYSFGLLRLNDGRWEFTSDRARNHFSEPSDSQCHFTIDMTPKNCMINGVTRSTHNPDNFKSNRDIFIFGTSSSTRIRADKGDTGKKRIYWMKIWDGQTLVRDFQPCLDASSTPCLYDRISKQTFYNKGSLNLDYKLL